MTDPDGALTVRDVAHSPALQLRVLAGSGGLGRVVSWAHVSELPDPTPWLLGGELLLTTGIAVPKGAAAQRAYVRRLAEHGVAGLMMSAQLLVPPHTALLRAADECDLPILEAPLSVPFVSVVQEVAAAVRAPEGRALGAQLQVFGALRWVVEENLSAADTFARLERLSGYALALCTPSGRALLPGVAVPPPGSVVLPDRGVQAAPTVPGGYVLPVPAIGGTAGYLIARERKGARPAGLAVVAHIATVAALHVTMLRHEREILRREGAETLVEMLGGILDAQTVRRRLHRLGMPNPRRVVLAIARGRGDAADDRGIVAALDERGVPYLLLRQRDEIVLLVPATLATTVVLDEQSELTVGSSSAFTAGESLEIPRREATWAASRAADAGRAHVHFEADDSSGRWLPQDVHALRALIERALGAVVRYDSEHGTDLVPTVRAWLAEDRRSDRTVEQLHIHPNTLAYRLRRFTAISGLDLTSTADLAETWLALSATEHVGDA